ncbi:MAG: CpsD/CapB family tyrosine-protein kinase [Candidatus Sulfotelmatobacter sp.]
MSNVYRALRQAELESDATTTTTQVTEALHEELFDMVSAETSWLDEAALLRPIPPPESRLVTIAEHNSLAAEKFRVLKTRLRHLQQKHELKTILITSASPGEGKTMVASNLAVTLSRHTSQRVLLLEGDLRHPALARQFGLRDLRGITEWFATDDPLSRFVYRVEGLRLWSLLAGQPAVESLTILQSTKFTEGVSQLAPAFDWVIIDAPPLVPLADVHVLSALAEGLVLVVRQGKAPKKALAKGLGGLDGAKVLGVVFNDAQAIEPGYYDQYYSPQVRTGKTEERSGVAQ